MRNIDRKTYSLSSNGFSLLEFAIVLAVFAMVLGTFLVPLTKQIEQQRYTETQRILESARDALVSFAAANGRLPCPSVDGAAEGPGFEAFSVAPVGNSGNGSCLNFYSGYLPAVTLGFTPVNDEGYAVDAWGLRQNRIRYAVSKKESPVGNYIFTRANGLNTAPTPADAIEKISDGTYKSLYVCADKPNPAVGPDCGLPPPPAAPPNGPLRLANGNAIAVVYSLGANAADTPSATEAINSDLAKVNPVYVSHSLRTTGETFDDVVTWIGPNLLIGRMLAAGRLP
jgi:prepilin-type N-terminal cleavage/methylation domain-containing protein